MTIFFQLHNCVFHLKFGYSQKATKSVTSNFKWKIISNFVAFSEYPNFELPVKIFDPILKCIDFKKKTDANIFQSRSEARSATVTVRVSNLRDFLAMFSPVDRWLLSCWFDIMSWHLKSPIITFCPLLFGQVQVILIFR